jgi:hypothetical protein
MNKQTNKELQIKLIIGMIIIIYMFFPWADACILENNDGGNWDECAGVSALYIPLILVYYFIVWKKYKAEKINDKLPEDKK